MKAFSRNRHDYRIIRFPDIAQSAPDYRYVLIQGICRDQNPFIFPHFFKENLLTDQFRSGFQ
ncbi:hypothetical protein AOT23_05320 [Klebsiella pneumoniae]|nr:hypothetical protein AOT23_05320 [Klebsiella pneumoniae]SWW29213.1 Uncharacterised protein [Klebsiella pneumoniae]SWY75111.1 Uncharacterised protein [Klebsiella pneumoniae]SXJ32444.1 Uncharacterised protein [Klebsiella pneumoniae]SYG72818.1 Uncharacterised protein [Klebsiella pneumoniae]